ncbi:hypothetical protein [uncultured Clostridium sp.]|uniref:hypothetical protein n=1 Tax=uncultured Clostridium sp. TaxID=59620 RepID=UPI0026110B67|nr:hypothetical protein [uncultured Clostridium sp.]
MKILKRIIMTILLIVIWPIGLIFLVKSKIGIKKKIIIGVITFIIFLVFWGAQFLMKYMEVKEEAQYMTMQNKYIDNVINTSVENIKGYDKNKIYSSNKVINYLANAYVYTINGENKIADAIQDKIDNKISEKDFVKIINNEDRILTTFSDGAEELWHSGYLSKSDKYRSSIVSDSIDVLIDINKNFIIEGINSDTIKDFDVKTGEVSKIMKNVINN